MTATVRWLAHRALAGCLGAAALTGWVVLDQARKDAAARQAVRDHIAAVGDLNL